MGFFDDLRKTIDSVLGVPGGSGILGEDQYLNRDGVHPMSDEGLKAPDASPHQTSLADAIAIQQTRSSQFNTFNISPFNLDKTAYPCQVSLQKIFDLLGVDGETVGAFPGDATNLQSAQINPWRTVVISTPGNFLKLEFLPTKMNRLPVNGGWPNGPIISGSTICNTNEDHNSLSGLIASGLYGGSHNPDHMRANGLFEIFANNSIIVQFESTDAPMLLAKHGDIFKTPFNQVYLTVKSGMPRFQVVVGYNSEIVSNNTNRLLNANPAYGGGSGLWDNSPRHCTPFSVCHSLYMGSFSSTPSTYASTSVGGNTYVKKDIFTNMNSSAYQKGSAFGWITSLSLAIAAGGSADTEWKGALLVQVFPLTPGTFANDELDTTAKMIAMIPFCFISNARQSFSNASSTQQHQSPVGYYEDWTEHYLTVAAAANYENFHEVKNFSIPVRFMLRPGDTLRVTVVNASASGVDYSWSMDGYVYGKIDNSLNRGHGSESPMILEAVTEPVFPLDHALSCSDTSNFT